jgi:hypothetical protein
MRMNRDKSERLREEAVVACCKMKAKNLFGVMKVAIESAVGMKDPENTAACQVAEFIGRFMNVHLTDFNARTRLSTLLTKKHVI